MRAALYARVSTLEQEPENQLEELRRYVLARGWTATEYVDYGVSGAKETRPALDALVKDATRRKVDVLVCWRLDRLGRNLKHLVTLLDELSVLGVAFVSLQGRDRCHDSSWKVADAHPGCDRGIRTGSYRRAGPGGARSGQGEREASGTTSDPEASCRDPRQAHSASGGSGVGCLEIYSGQVDQQRQDTGGTNPAEVALTFAPVLFITRHTIRGRDNQMIPVPRADTVFNDWSLSMLKRLGDLIAYGIVLAFAALYVGYLVILFAIVFIGE